jgi:hypothetical protein
MRSELRYLLAPGLIRTAFEAGGEQLSQDR